MDDTLDNSFYNPLDAEAAVDDAYTAVEDLKGYRGFPGDDFEGLLEVFEELPYSINRDDFSEDQLDEALEAYEGLVSGLEDAEDFVTDSGIHVGEALSAIGYPDRLNAGHTSVMIHELDDMGRVEEVEDAIEKVDELYSSVESLYRQVLRPVLENKDVEGLDRAEELFREIQ